MARIEGGKQMVLRGLDQGLTDRIATEFARLCSFPEPVTKLPDFLMEAQKAIDTWGFTRKAMEDSLEGPM